MVIMVKYAKIDIDIVFKGLQKHPKFMISFVPYSNPMA